MDRILITQTIFTFFSGLLLTGASLFVSAGTFDYPQAWLLLVVLAVLFLCGGILLLYRRPELLERRVRIRENEAEQKQTVLLSGLLVLGACILAGLNYRFGWTVLPGWIPKAAAGVFLAGFILYAEVFRENEFLFRTIEVREGQSVIDRGLYGFIRHPMYLSTLILLLSMPLILGSPVSVLVLLFYIPVLVKRIRQEEGILERELHGYVQYKRKVRFRILPFIW